MDGTSTSTDTSEPWPDTDVPDWAPEAVRFDFADPDKTIPVSWAADMLCRWHARNRANFGNELAKTAARWSDNKLGDEGKN